MSIDIHAVLNRAATTADASSNSSVAAATHPNAAADASSNSSVAAATHPNAACTHRRPLHRPRDNHLFIRTAALDLLTLTSRINVTIAVAKGL
jgi:hypothetical protein